MVLSALYVRLRDTQQLWSVVQQLLFFGSPIIYVASRYPESMQGVMNLSPLTAIFTQMRHALLDPSAPTAAETAGGALMLLIPIGLTLLTVGGRAVVLHPRGAANRRAALAGAERPDQAVGLSEQRGEVGRPVGRVAVEEAMTPWVSQAQRHRSRRSEAS